MDHADLSQLLRMLAALAFVLALMGGFVVLLRKLGISTNIPSVAKRRLKLVEILPLDSRRKLAIIQRDDKQHLVILGSGNETLIESGFESAQDTNNDKKNDS